MGRNTKVENEQIIIGEIEGNLDLGKSIEVVGGRELAMMEPITTTPNHQITKCIPSDDDDDDDDGLQAHSHHDKFPPWWVFVRDDYGGNLSVTKSHH